LIKGFTSFFSGLITTKAEFDREERAVYAVIIEAEDGAPSSLLQNGQPNVTPQKFRIAIADKNDNPPYFPQSTYHAEVTMQFMVVMCRKSIVVVFNFLRNYFGIRSRAVACLG
jgi:hypothetical protein